MTSGNSPRMRALRMLMMADATVLGVLGVALVLRPEQILAAFHFKDLPVGVNYFIGMWGCTLFTLAAGTAIAAFDPRCHVLWVQVAIARGALECAFGIWSLTHGLVSWEQSGFGILLAGAFAIALIVLYPRREAN